jgi:fatty acid desaturase
MSFVAALQPLNAIHLVAPTRRERQPSMLWTIALILIVLWVLGLVSSYTMGGFIHILLVLAIVVILIRVIQGRRIA